MNTPHNNLVRCPSGWLGAESPRRERPQGGPKGEGKARVTSTQACGPATTQLRVDEHSAQQSGEVSEWLTRSGESAKRTPAGRPEGRGQSPSNEHAGVRTCHHPARVDEHSAQQSGEVSEWLTRSGESDRKSTRLNSSHVANSY